MKKRRRLLSLLLAVVMLLSMPLTSVVASAFALDGNETVTGPIDPSTLNVKKLGSTDGIQIPEDDGDDDAFDPDTVVRASIFLKDSSVLEKGYAFRGIANNRLAEKYREKLRNAQDAMQETIEKLVGHKLTVKWNLTLAANAISVELPYRDIARIKNLAGVQSVVLESLYEAPRDAEENHPNTASTSENMVGATTAWAQGYTGAGSRVAIIDTGLDIDHQSVAEDPFLHSIEELEGETGKTYSLFTAEDLNQITSDTSITLNAAAPKRVSAKIPYAYNYIDSNDDVTHLNDTQGEHGSHVAGISAANKYLKKDNDYVLSSDETGAVGMAPDAQLFVMKVFGAGGGAYDSDYMAAIEDAIVLDCDVVNLSLGSSVQGWTFSEEYQDIMNKVADQATNEGMVVSISAGNSYSLIDMMEPANISKYGLYIEDVNMHTGGSPGTYVNSLCVAAAQNTLTKGVPLYFDGDLNHKVFYAESLEGSDGTAYGNAAMTTITGVWDYVFIDARGEAVDYEAVAKETALDGKVLIVNRGDISFAEKGNNAKAYNPKAVIVANNADGVIHMDLTGYEATFPMVSILKVDADRLRTSGTLNKATKLDEVGAEVEFNFYTGSIDVRSEIESDLADRVDTTITDFSSWGAPGSLLMKPEITAPGGDILSIWGTNKTSSNNTAGGTDKYELMSGTSMAAPHITGLAAVIAQYLRENGWLEDTAQSLYNTELTEKYSTRAINQSLMMSQATPMKNKNGEGEYHYLSILQQGAGLVEVNNAVTSPSVIMIDDEASYLTGLTGAAADGKVKIELGDDPEKNGTYTYKFDIYNITDYPLTYSFHTDIFSQEIVSLEEYGDGTHMGKTTVDIPVISENYTMTVSGLDNSHDVNKDGKTNEKDVQAILDYLTGKVKASKLNLDAAKVDNDDAITSHDAQLLLDMVSSNTVLPHNKATVIVEITIDPVAFGTDYYPRGAYIEGFTYATCDSTYYDGTDEISVAHEHSIPILGFYGSWTDPSMFDAASYADTIYHMDGEGDRWERTSYTGHDYVYNEETDTISGYTNYMTLTMGGSQVVYSGNPYMVEEEYPEERLAIRSDAMINSIVYNLYRASAATGFAVSAIDGLGGKVTDVKSAMINGTAVSSIYFSQTGWANTATKAYTVNKTPESFGFSKDGETFRIGFYAIPEYNAMVQKDSYDKADSTLIDNTVFKAILESNTLGKGAYLGYDFTIDDTAPQFINGKEPKLNGNTIQFSASDNQNIAYAAVLPLNGGDPYAEAAPGKAAYDASFDVSEAIANANGYVAVLIADYAGNETAYCVKVNDNITVPKDVYVLTDTIAAGNEYLIVNTKEPGSAKGLYYTSSTLSRSAAAFDVNINEATDASGDVYIETAGIPETGVWTAVSQDSDWNFKNGDYYLARSLSNVAFNGITGNATKWIWDGSQNYLTNNTLTGTAHYLTYTDEKFAVGTSAGSVYLFEKTTIHEEILPDEVASISITPETLDLYKGNTVQLSASILPLTAKDRDVNWLSADESVATVDENGKVTAVAPGVTNITAQSHASPGIQAICTVSVTEVDKELNAIVQDEHGKIHFSKFNANSLNPNSNTPYTKLSSEVTASGGDSLVNAYLASSSTLYASTQNFTGTSYLYKFDASTFAADAESTVKTYVAPFGLAASTNSLLLGGDFAAFGFAYFLLAGPLADSDGEGALMPYGMLDTSETDIGGAYIASVCVAEAGNLLTNLPTYYVLDETGKIWQSAIKRADNEITSATDILANMLTYTFTQPQLVVDTGIATSFSNQNIYFDGTYIYWSHCEGDTCELIIINPESKQVYHAGDFGENVWPVGGMYTANSVAPSSISDDTVTQMSKEELATYSALMREKLNAPEIMARMQAEAEKTSNVSAAAQQTAAVPAIEEVKVNYASVETAVRYAAPAVGIKSIQPQVSSDEEADPGEISFSETVDSKNGLFTVKYPEGLTFNKAEAAEIEGLYYSVYNDKKNRTVKVAYAKEGVAIPAETEILKLYFDAACEVKGDVEVQTVERNYSYNLTDSITVNVPGIGHDWDEGVLSPAPTCTSFGVRIYTCKHDATHTKTEVVDMLPHTAADAVKENEIPATAAEQGSYDSVVYCSVCGKELSREHIITDKVTEIVISEDSDYFEAEETVELMKVIDGIQPNTSVSDLYANFDNVRADLRVYKDDGVTRVTDGTIATGYYLKLVAADTKIVDTAILVVKGDNNGDALVDVVDVKLALNTSLGKPDALTGIFAMASDVNNDEEIDVVDVKLILNVSLGKQKTFVEA